LRKKDANDKFSDKIIDINDDFNNWSNNNGYDCVDDKLLLGEY
jgi:hypothetical protein